MSLSLMSKEKPNHKQGISSANKILGSLLTLFLVGVCICWLFNLSYWKMAIIYAAILSTICAMGVVEIHKKLSRQYEITRIYNNSGTLVENRFVIQLENGHWVTVVSDMENSITRAEHTRTDENGEALGREESIRQDQEYNTQSIFGTLYGKNLRRKISRSRTT